MPSITINITHDNGTKETAKITGPAASAGLDTFGQWMATQTVTTQVPGVPAVLDGNGVEVTPAVPPSTTVTPKFANHAEGFKEVLLGTLEQLAPRFPSAATQADAAEIDAKIAALEAKRKALFAAARGEK